MVGYRLRRWKKFLGCIYEQSLQDIKTYYEQDLQNPSAFIKILKAITQRIRNLEDFPNSGRKLSAIVGIETDSAWISLCQQKKRPHPVSFPGCGFIIGFMPDFGMACLWCYPLAAFSGYVLKYENQRGFFGVILG